MVRCKQQCRNGNPTIFCNISILRSVITCDTSIRLTSGLWLGNPTTFVFKTFIANETFFCASWFCLYRLLVYFQLLSVERINLYACSIRLCFLLFESMRQHLKFQLEVTWASLLVFISHINYGFLPETVKLCKCILKLIVRTCLLLSRCT